MKYYGGLLIALMVGCKPSSPSNVQFYHWKSKAEYSPKIQSALDLCQTSKVFMHYFDVTEQAMKNGLNIYPEYPILSIDPKFKSYEIIPVVFISNQCMKNSSKVPLISQKIKGLVHQINQHYEINTDQLQIDCDWTESTEENFFSLLENLQDDFDLSATIRLHQIKYKEKTGVPPINKGVLMLYNMGNLKNKDENSIIESQIVQQYINQNSDYPLELDLALPLFSQTVIIRKNGNAKLINRSIHEELISHESHFEAIGNNCFKVKKDTLVRRLMLQPGDLLKCEESSLQEIQKSREVIENSKLKINDIILYHLDSLVLSDFDLKTLINHP